MVTISRSLVLASAVVAGLFVAALETTGPRAESSPATVQVAQRFPQAGETFKAMPITSYVAPKFVAALKAPRPPKSESCASTPNGWPYVSQECLVAALDTLVAFVRS